MYNSDTYTLSGSPDELSRVLRCSVAEFNIALGDLQHHNAAIVGVRNGVVTLVSRRLEREHKKRKQGALRISKYREKRVCNAESASVSEYASASDSSGKGGLGERAVELPRGFPPTVDEAIHQTQLIGADAAFVTTLWNGAMARNGQDALGQDIRSWPHYVAKHWPKEQAKRFEDKKKQNPYAAEERARAERTRRLLG